MRRIVALSVFLVSVVSSLIISMKNLSEEHPLMLVQYQEVPRDQLLTALTV